MAERRRRNKVKSRNEKSRQTLRPIPSTEPAARDEGPRLIPLDDRLKEPSRLEHYLELADTALGLKRAER
jgi:hypothetical protein